MSEYDGHFVLTPHAAAVVAAAVDGHRPDTGESDLEITAQDMVDTTPNAPRSMVMEVAKHAAILIRAIGYSRGMSHDEVAGIVRKSAQSASAARSVLAWEEEEDEPDE